MLAFLFFKKSEKGPQIPFCVSYVPQCLESRKCGEIFRKASYKPLHQTLLSFGTNPIWLFGQTQSFCQCFVCATYLKKRPETPIKDTFSTESNLTEDPQRTTERCTARVNPNREKKNMECLFPAFVFLLHVSFSFFISKA